MPGHLYIFLQPRETYLPECPRNGLEQDIVHSTFNRQQPFLLLLFQPSVAQDETLSESVHRCPVHFRPVGFYSCQHVIDNFSFSVGQFHPFRQRNLCGQGDKQPVEGQFRFPIIFLCRICQILQQEHGTDS